MDSVTRQTVEVGAAGTRLVADLAIPRGARGLVLFAHGSGSSRFSPRNRFVAGELNRRGLATLLAGLLTEAEDDLDEYRRELRFDVGLLGRRLVGITDWAASSPVTRELRLGYFGSASGAAAAVLAAVEREESVSALVSRGGRPDLAGRAIQLLAAPTRLIVGADDESVLALNELTFARMRAPKDLVIVPRAGSSFDEPGALETVAERAADWLTRYLGRAEAEPPPAWRE